MYQLYRMGDPISRYARCGRRDPEDDIGRCRRPRFQADAVSSQRHIAGKGTLPARMPPLKPQTMSGVAANLLRAISFDSAGPMVRTRRRLQDEKEASMTRSVILGAVALAFSGVAASAQAVYVSPGYLVAPTYVAPAYIAPTFVAPPVYVAPSAPIYGYGPGALDAYTVVEPDSAW